MSSDKRDFKNFNEFPGTIHIGRNRYEFPTLNHLDSKGKSRFWNIYVRIIKDNNLKQYKQNWNLLEDNELKIKESYISGTEKLPENTLSQIWVEAGIIGMKTSRHPPSYKKRYYNKDKADERNPLQAALIEARSRYLKRINQGGRDSTNLISIINHNTQKKDMYFPMLLTDYSINNSNIKYPLYAQRKYDGIRALIFLNTTSEHIKNVTIENVIIYTREQKPILGYDHIRKEVLKILIDMYNHELDQSIYLDGEFYKHGKSLQFIAGEVRNPKRNNVISASNYFYFDTFYPYSIDCGNNIEENKNKTVFEDRIKWLNEIEEKVKSYKFKHLIKAETTIVNNEKEMLDLFNKYLNDGYEGIVVRDYKSLYYAHPTQKTQHLRSKTTLRKKPTFSDEFEVVGFTQGNKGKDIGAILWICKTKNDKTFTVGPKNQTYVERYNIYKDAVINFDKKYKGRLLKIEYQGLSKDGIPQRLKSIGFRDFE